MKEKDILFFQRMNRNERGGRLAKVLFVDCFFRGAGVSHKYQRNKYLLILYVLYSLSFYPRLRDLHINETRQRPKLLARNISYHSFSLLLFEKKKKVFANEEFEQSPSYSIAALSFSVTSAAAPGLASLT